MEQDRQFIQPPTDDAIYDLAETEVAPPTPDPSAMRPSPVAAPEPGPAPLPRST